MAPKAGLGVHLGPEDDVDLFIGYVGHLVADAHVKRDVRVQLAKGVQFFGYTIRQQFPLDADVVFNFAPTWSGTGRLARLDRRQDKEAKA